MNNSLLFEIDAFNRFRQITRRSTKRVRIYHKHLNQTVKSKSPRRMDTNCGDYVVCNWAVHSYCHHFRWEENKQNRWEYFKRMDTRFRISFLISQHKLQFWKGRRTHLHLRIYNSNGGRGRGCFCTIFICSYFWLKKPFKPIPAPSTSHNCYVVNWAIPKEIYVLITRLKDRELILSSLDFRLRSFVNCLIS